jgi:hypothetical protein
MDVLTITSHPSNNVNLKISTNRGVDIVFKRKKTLYVAVIIIVILLIGSIRYLTVGNGVNTKSLFVNDIEVNNEKLHIVGTTTSSALAFAGYYYTIENQSLYLKLRYTIVNQFHSNGDFSITINDNLMNIKKIYLQGMESEDLELVWTN